MRWCTSLISISRCAMAAASRASSAARCAVTSEATISNWSGASAAERSETMRMSHTRCAPSRSDAPGAVSSAARRSSRCTLPGVASARCRSAASFAPSGPGSHCDGTRPRISFIGRPAKVAAIWFSCTTCWLAASNSAMASGAVSMMRCRLARACTMLTSAWRRRSMSSSAYVSWRCAVSCPVTTTLPTTQKWRPSRARRRHSKVSAWPSSSVSP